jgi:hypothetical protein
VKRLSQRWFLLRDAHAKDGMVLMQPRWAMSFMRGPMTRTEIRRALAGEATRAGVGLRPDVEQAQTPEGREETVQNRWPTSGVP